LSELKTETQILFSDRGVPLCTEKARLSREGSGQNHYWDEVPKEQGKQSSNEFEEKVHSRVWRKAPSLVVEKKKNSQGNGRPDSWQRTNVGLT